MSTRCTAAGMRSQRTGWPNMATTAPWPSWKPRRRTVGDTAIEWAEVVWNPTTGCDRVSPGCDHCYALTMAKRLKAMGQAKYQTDGDPRTSGPGFGLALHPATLQQPLRWRKPRRIFVNSMSDLFHDKATDEYIASVFAVMAATPHHTYQLLTKRHARMRSLLSSPNWRGSVAGLVRTANPDQSLADFDAATLEFVGEGLLRNVWVGISVEDQHWADIRIPALLDTPAAVRWISAEPLLGPIDLGWVGGVDALQRDWIGGPSGGSGAPHPLLDWVVAGGESGHGARPMNPDWMRSLRDQCQAAGVAFFVKQMGSRWESRWGRNHHDIEQFPEDLQVRQYPEAHCG
jgi:protein gp37